MSAMLRCGLECNLALRVNSDMECPTVATSWALQSTPNKSLAVKGTGVPAPLRRSVYLPSHGIGAFSLGAPVPLAERLIFGGYLMTDIRSRYHVHHGVHENPRPA